MSKNQESYILSGDPNQPIRKFFQGEMMMCAICGKQQQSDPAIESHWTIIEIEGDPKYICPKHLPLNDPHATRGDFIRAYRRIFRKLGVKGE
jgi:hypothetical protein